jgi:hypothetical protein
MDLIFLKISEPEQFMGDSSQDYLLVAFLFRRGIVIDFGLLAFIFVLVLGIVFRFFFLLFLALLLLVLLYHFLDLMLLGFFFLLRR